MITIVELPEFIRQSKKLLTESEQNNLINYLASHPTAGVWKIRKGEFEPGRAQ
jgi:hypothetical protein